jgi:glycosyltransferase involved in cell wall biosynthesis
MKKGKIGVGITTYNSESYFKTLYDSLQNSKIDELVVVNGGSPYTGDYKCKWIQDEVNRFPSACRNDCISYLLETGCEHIFLIEDDMIIKRPDIFEEYIKHSQISGLDYLCFVSTSGDCGIPHKRTPKVVIQYSPSTSISFYANMCNEFTYHHYTCFEKCGLYDSNLRDLFDVEMVYRQTKSNSKVSPFWWFADITNSDDFVENNPVAVSRLQTDRPDGSRNQIIGKMYEYFLNKHKLNVNQIPSISKENFVECLKQIKNNARLD